MHDRCTILTTEASDTLLRSHVSTRLATGNAGLCTILSSNCYLGGSLIPDCSFSDVVHFAAVSALLRKSVNSAVLPMMPLSYSAILVSSLPFTVSTT
jgi:hypothetical protein